MPTPLFHPLGRDDTREKVGDTGVPLEVSAACSPAAAESDPGERRDPQHRSGGPAPDAQQSPSSRRQNRDDLPGPGSRHDRTSGNIRHAAGVGAWPGAAAPDHGLQLAAQGRCAAQPMYVLFMYGASYVYVRMICANDMPCMLWYALLL